MVETTQQNNMCTNNNLVSLLNYRDTPPQNGVNIFITKQ